jgi:penicillin-binding protein 1C
LNGEPLKPRKINFTAGYISHTAMHKKFITILLLAFAVGALVGKTRTDLLPLPDSLNFDDSEIRKVQIMDRRNVPLTITYQNRWNIHDFIPLHEIPVFLQKVFVISEDHRFYRHRGVDWRARLHAMYQNARALRPLRGASTISEQVIRMWHPRPRSIWSRWLEGIEATRLERQFSKAEILQFYLNQVPYASQRRGVSQAAAYYFDRDLETLSLKEMLALVVMVRAPGRLNLFRGFEHLNQPILQLAGRLLERRLIDTNEYAQICSEGIQVRPARLAVKASHFVHYVYRSTPVLSSQPKGRLQTTLDAGLQNTVQKILDHCLRDLEARGASNGAVLVIDHRSDEVLAWVNGTGGEEMMPGSWIDAVTTPRQPGSTLKPFLYALALEKGWSAATIVHDFPLIAPIGRGLHSYNNYSRTHYGSLRVREALGNSLNIPAVHAIRFVGVENFLLKLKLLGIQSLKQHPDYYGDGLALGNGEITLLELVRAYAVLARAGTHRPIKLLVKNDRTLAPSRTIFSTGVTSIIADILSDPEARRLEFGYGGLLRFPVQTAVKTGTSSDYQDAWAIGFNYRFTVGVWMGDLKHRPMDGITGAAGPALVLRAVFSELNRHRLTRPLFLSPRLVKLEICRDSGLPADGQCSSMREWFVPGIEPIQRVRRLQENQSIRWRQPTNGLQLALDPRIPDAHEAFLFVLDEIPQGATVDWYVNDQFVGETTTGEYLWPLQRGDHILAIKLGINQLSPSLSISTRQFTVK